MRCPAPRGTVLALGLALGAATAGPADAVPPEAQRGEAVFQQRCVACHTVGQGDRVGPDLAGVGSRRDPAWLARWIAAPDRVLAAGDPVARALLQKYNNVPMPNQGLAADEVAALLAYLTASSGATPASPAAAPASPAATAPSPGPSSPGVAAAPAGPAPPATAPAGDAATGKALFTGTRRLRNGGPACMACHSIAGIGALGGGALGPDLTAAAAKYGPAGLGSVLAALPFPTMAPIFGARPLAPDEQADLSAFLASAPVSGRAPAAMGRLGALAAVGAALLFALAQLRWRHRLAGVRAPMVAAARARAAAGPAAPSRRP